MNNTLRIIGRYDQNRPGPLFICLGAIHGNEPAGVEAIRAVLGILNSELESNPDFTFSGRFLGLVGNMRALEVDKRYIGEDMNRILTSERIQNALTKSLEELRDEDVEIKELVEAIEKEIDDYDPPSIVVLDIHTTSAAGGIFVLVSEESESIRIGKELHAPVILDFGREVYGTTLKFFSKDNYNRDITSVVFECGQHREMLSVNRGIAAIVNCMGTIGSINENAIENEGNLLLKEYSKGLPRIARLIERYAIEDDQSFKMIREFKNFEPVSAGEIIAYSGDKPVSAQHDGLILLPRLQEIGNDGYFIVKAIES